MTCTFHTALTIAGSDPSGGAGIQVDLKTFAEVGVWGMAVVTALTAQNATRVSGVWSMECHVVRNQIATLLEDITPGAVKTGMLSTAEIIHTVVQTLPETIPLIVDPVMISTSGHRLLDESAIRCMKEVLLPRATAVTPNIPEAEVLAGMRIIDDGSMIEAGMKILDLGTEAVVVKGGHGTGDESVDLLIDRNGVTRLTSPRMPYQVHGSGCCFSAAVTGFMAQGYGVAESCRLGKDIVTKAIKEAIAGSGGMRMINPGGVQ
ncbi:bifunctional hydroxymethylpyrimidine kinase/phosphomethylpyrimidine kinase [Methanospirillum lacunae]|uniref:Bifunctional hydroxymethylpyrimidine kinase/phosphomethylpyrimidine kinase n=1 Tax=Methanospirillum lacunae TaxID=668570 RepID=A0A2V2MTQ3_9EURY|nr:bifunctional hydroxymethylpyrimidine kinase/phosphomethylpyrimidine kinase [Methanospirillum lacunae]PWR71574.1 bifunctional hydroxymethylpyrimidine kinase/phosphomethylpyrimidine kinase [Methanospirillum lacunae]